MPIAVFAADEQSAEKVDLDRWRVLAERVLLSQGLSGDVELNLLYVEEEAIAALNQRFLGHEGPTDVLSFPIEDELVVDFGTRPLTGAPYTTGPGRQAFEDEDEFPVPDDAPLLIGDIVICPAVAARNAPEHAGSYDDEMALLLVHGILHLLGLDHEQEEEAEVMEARERELLALHHTIAGSK
jgi:probable rRNA maturation factor